MPNIVAPYDLRTMMLCIRNDHLLVQIDILQRKTFCLETAEVRLPSSLAVTVEMISKAAFHICICCTARLSEHSYRLRQQSHEVGYHSPSTADAYHRYRAGEVSIASVAPSSSQQDTWNLATWHT